MSSILYKREAAWGLPSLSPGCIQAEALLRFAGADFKVALRKEPGQSPTGTAIIDNFSLDPLCSGMFPAFDKDGVLSHDQECRTEFDCVRRIKEVNSAADSYLTASDTTLAKGLAALIEQELEPATLYTMWCENEGYKEYKEAFGGQLLFPLNQLVANTEKWRISKLLSELKPEEVYDRACNALDGLSGVLEKRNGFLFGDSPCSVDALLYGHLLFYRLAPSASPQLKKKLEELSSLKKYIDRISSDYFKEVAPALEDVQVDLEKEDESFSVWTTPKGNLWSSMKKLWEDLKTMDKGSKMWLGGAATLLIVYSWFRPPFVVVLDDSGMIDDEDDSD